MAHQDKPSAEKQEEGDPIYEFPGNVQPGTNPWLHLDHNKEENEKWMKQLRTLHYFAAAFEPMMDKKDDQFFQTLCIYSSAKWLPKNTFNNHFYKRTQETLDAWEKENPQIESTWNLYDRETGFYTRWNKYKDTLYVDLIYKKKWFSDFDIKVTNKIYFWRATYDKEFERYASSHARMMVDKLNLCYCAWRKTMECKPDYVSSLDIPIITFTAHKEHKTKYRGNWKSTSKYPEWSYIPLFNKSETKDETKENSDNVSLGTIIDDETKVRKSIRLAAKHENKKKIFQVNYD